MNKKQLEKVEKYYPVGAMVRQHWGLGPEVRYGIIIASGLDFHGHIEVYTSDGERELSHRSDWEIIARP